MYFIFLERDAIFQSLEITFLTQIKLEIVITIVFPILAKGNSQSRIET